MERRAGVVIAVGALLAVVSGCAATGSDAAVESGEECTADVGSGITITRADCASTASQTPAITSEPEVVAAAGPADCGVLRSGNYGLLSTHRIRAAEEFVWHDELPESIGRLPACLAIGEGRYWEGPRNDVLFVFGADVDAFDDLLEALAQNGVIVTESEPWSGGDIWSSVLEEYDVPTVMYSLDGEVLADDDIPLGPTVTPMRSFAAFVTEAAYDYAGLARNHGPIITLVLNTHAA